MSVGDPIAILWARAEAAKAARTKNDFILSFKKLRRREVLRCCEERIRMEIRLWWVVE